MSRPASIFPWRPSAVQATVPRATPALLCLVCMAIAVLGPSQASPAESTQSAVGAVREGSTQPAAKRLFRAGAAASNITPMLDGAIIGGWTSPKATYIRDELFAKCLVLDDGATRIAIVIADNIGLPREVCDEAKRMIREHTGIAEDRVLIAATHTHSSVGARPANVLKPDDDFNPYARFVARRISDGVRRAVAHLESAQIAWGSVSAPEHVNNRRWFLKPEVKLVNPFGGLDKVRMNPAAGSPDLLKPAGPVDPEVCFISIRSTDGRPIALLANYSLHYVGGIPGTDISADYFGVFADRIQELLKADRLHPPFVAMLSNGTSGDVNNISFQKPRPPRKPYEQMRYVADDLAQKVFKAHETLTWHDWVGVDMRQCELALKVRKPTPEQLERAKAILAGAPTIPERPHEAVYAQRIIHQQEAPAEISVVLQAVRIGQLGIAAIPFEVLVEIGLEMKQKSPLRPTFTISLANGSYGYLPTPSQHELGGYETWLGTSKVEIEASTKIVHRLLEMFEALK